MPAFLMLQHFLMVWWPPTRKLFSFLLHDYKFSWEPLIYSKKSKIPITWVTILQQGGWDSNPHLKFRSLCSFHYTCVPMIQGECGKILGEESGKQQQQRVTHSWKCRQMEKTRHIDQKGLRGGGEETTGTEHRVGSAEAHLGTGGVWRWCWKSGKGRVSHNAVSAQGVWAPQRRKCWDTETRHSQSWFREMIMWDTDEGNGRVQP